MNPPDNRYIPAQESEMIISKAVLNKKRQRKKMSAYYSFLTIVLFFCLIQFTFSAVLNISKAVSYKQKIQVMKNTKEQVIKKNKQLKTEIGNFSTSSSWESIARNNLKMAGENEVLVIINNNKSNNTDETTERNNDGKHN